jgi:Predicted Zn-dependent peptidases
MQSNIQEFSELSVSFGEKAKKIDSFMGIDIFKIETNKFKTNSINFFFLDNLTRKNVTINALIPAVLRRGCKSFPTFRDIAMRMEELYGASFDCSISKKGECQIIQFYTEFMSDTYSPKNVNLFENIFSLLYEIINEPIVENGVFKEEYLVQEKENLRKLIEGRINDKMQYVVERCYEEMCKDEPFGLYEYGYTSDLQGIRAVELYGKYKQMLENYPMMVYLSGNLDDRNVDLVIKSLKSLKRDTINKVNRVKIDNKDIKVKNITDKMNVTQGKLTMGFRTNTDSSTRDYYSLVVYNGILGGGIHSKLFQNVREKASLAYYAYSRVEKFMGLMVISSGIDLKNKEKAQEIILKQLEEIKKGNVSDYEYEATIKSMETGVKSMLDSQMQIVDFYLSQAVSGTEDTFDTLLQNLLKVTKQDIIDVSKRIQLDTVYFLDSNKTSGGSNEN